MERVTPIAYPKGLVAFFDQQVLASYRNEPHKYEITSDNFEGTLTVTDKYYRELEAGGKTDEYVSIPFGYRTLRDGNLAVVVWLPDLLEKSKHHAPKWAAFHLKNAEWTTERDERFENWIRRNIEGSFDVDNGPLFYLGETLQIVNGLTSELVGIPLYKHELDHTQVGYPAGENTHRYEDAHKTLYGYLIDGLDKDCMSELANKLGKTLKIGSKKTVEALMMLFPALQNGKHFRPSVSLVSDQRRLASHSARAPARSFPAFSTFTNDLYLCLDGVKEVLTMIEKEFGVDGRAASERHEAKKWLPRIVRPPQPNYSIVDASRMKGKTIEKVEVGTRDDIKEAHGSEAMIIYFTDGSIMGLETGSNAWNVATSEKPFKAEDLHVNFRVHWVPPLPKSLSVGCLGFGTFNLQLQSAQKYESPKVRRWPPRSPRVQARAAMMRLEVTSTLLLRRSFPNKSSQHMAFPHPQSRKQDYRKEDTPNSRSILWKFFKRTINIAKYRNAEDDVNPAKNRTLSGITHHGVLRINLEFLCPT